MRFSILAGGFLALAMVACASIGESNGDAARERLAAGLTALERGDFERASQDLSWVATHEPRGEIGRQALLAAAALEMDPRNPRRRLALGSDLIAAYLRQPDQTVSWLDPVARTLYLLSLELGAAEDRVAQAEADKEQAEAKAEQVQRQLPRLPSPSVASQLRDAREERDRLAKRTAQLEEQLAERDKKLAEKDKELERIKKTLKS